MGKMEQSIFETESWMGNKEKTSFTCSCDNVVNQ